MRWGDDVTPLQRHYLWLALYVSEFHVAEASIARSAIPPVSARRSSHGSTSDAYISSFIRYYERERVALLFPSVCVRVRGRELFVVDSSPIFLCSAAVRFLFADYSFQNGDRTVSNLCNGALGQMNSVLQLEYNRRSPSNAVLLDIPPDRRE